MDAREQVQSGGGTAAERPGTGVNGVLGGPGLPAGLLREVELVVLVQQHGLPRRRRSAEASKVK